MPKSKFYAVKKGKATGVFTNWEDCKASVVGFKGAVYKSFATEKEAMAFLDISGALDVSEQDNQSIAENEMIAYVDGSYEHSIKTYAYAGVVFYDDVKDTFSGSGTEEELVAIRNVAGELKAAMYAMRLAKQIGKSKLRIYYDYEGIEKWALKKWKTNSDVTKKYAEYAQKMMSELEIIFIKVQAHSGDKYNEEVDGLAKLALKKEN